MKTMVYGLHMLQHRSIRTLSTVLLLVVVTA